MTLSLWKHQSGFVRGNRRDARIIECADDAFPLAPMGRSTEKAFVLQAPPRSGLRTAKSASSHGKGRQNGKKDAKLQRVSKHVSNIG